MKHALQLFTILCGIIGFAATSIAQLTITRSDIEAAAINKKWISTSDTVSRELNLGTLETGQTWDFSFLNLNAATVRRDTENLVAAATLPGAGNFPTATLGGTRRETETSGGITFTITSSEFIQMLDTGAYLLGASVRVQASPAVPGSPADTTYLIRVVPRALGLPLPIAATGELRSAVDTVVEPIAFGGATEINTRTFRLGGSGMMTLPGGRQVEAIRVLEDRVVVETRNGVTTRDRWKTVTFVTKDFTRLEFTVDTLYRFGMTTVQGEWSLTLPSGPATGVARTSELVPAGYALAQNYPNPFNPTTAIRFDVAGESFVTLTVYNMIGQEVAVLANGRYAPGTYTATFDASHLPSGMYVYRLSADGFVQTKSMVLVK